MKKEIESLLGVDNIEHRVTLPPVAGIAKIEAEAVNGAINYCEDNGYQHVLIPHMTGATGACENFSTLFSTDLFGKSAYFNQTGQLFLEAFMHEFDKTYCFGPSFRKENRADNRHLIEFPLFEIETAGVDLEALQGEVSGIFGSMIENIEQKCGKELGYLLDNPDLTNIKPPYASMTYRDAIDGLVEYGLKFGDDLKNEHEAALVEMNGGKPLFVTHYPKEIKFFNMRTNRSDQKIVNSMDLLMPYSGESVGAAEREEDYRVLRTRLEESDMLRLLEDAISVENGFKGSNKDALHTEAMSRFDWYLEVIKQHPIMHAGCGIGINRVVQSILKTDDIRYATAFPMNRETMF